MRTIEAKTESGELVVWECKAADEAQEVEEAEAAGLVVVNVY